MKCVLLMGSPRPDGNTAQLLRPFRQELERLGAEVETVRLHGQDLRPCTACRTCQQNRTGFGCSQPDDLPPIFDAILSADLILLATPIYSWYCTPPMKTLLDRLVYGMNKYYGAPPALSLWEGKAVAGLTTCGYPPEKGADLWEAGLKRYCKHSRLRYLGMLTEHDPGYGKTFFTDGMAERAAAFARQLFAALSAEPADHAV